jgi:deazaflavin-dependent oxidoreductase (nitroreductase family)
MTSNDEHTRAERGPAMPRWSLRAFTFLTLAVHRLSGGRLMNAINGDDICFITMKRAKSGRVVTIPLMYVPYRDGVLLVASQGGAPKNPGWYYSLLKYPDITVSHRGTRKPLRARIATPEEKPELWPVCDQFYAPYADYRTRTNRDIPIFVCEPVSGEGG